MTKEQLAKLEAALADVPEKFGVGQLYNPETGYYCILGWLGKKEGVPVEDEDAAINWARKDPVFKMLRDLFAVIAARYGLSRQVWSLNDNHQSRSYDSDWRFSYVNARAVADDVLALARKELSNA